MWDRLIRQQVVLNRKGATECSGVLKIIAFWAESSTRFLFYKKVFLAQYWNVLNFFMISVPKLS